MLESTVCTRIRPATSDPFDSLKLQVEKVYGHHIKPRRQYETVKYSRQYRSSSLNGYNIVPRPWTCGRDTRLSHQF